MYFCCITVITLVRVQYRSSPDGELYIIKKNITGIRVVIIFMLSPPLASVEGFFIILFDRIMVRVKSIGSSLISLQPTSAENTCLEVRKEQRK